MKVTTNKCYTFKIFLKYVNYACFYFMLCYLFIIIIIFIVDALVSIKRALNDPHGVLNNWDEDSVDPCSWAMITCSPENLVIGL